MSDSRCPGEAPRRVTKAGQGITVFRGLELKAGCQSEIQHRASNRPERERPQAVSRRACGPERTMARVDPVLQGGCS